MREAEVGWLAPDGSGGARVDGGTVRLPGALPGDTVCWREVERRGRSVVGEVTERVRSSPDRRAPACPWDAACGGCDLAAARPSARRRWLGEVVSRALELPVEVMPSPREVHHRARIKLGIEGGRLGFREARSRRLVEIGACLAAREELHAALDAVRGVLRERPGLAAEDVELRSDGERVVYAFHAARLGAEDRLALAALGDVAADGRAVHGDPTLRVPVAGLRLDAGPDVFYQVNLEANELLVAFVRDSIVAIQPERVLDLYAGIGNLGLPVAAGGVPVLAVELAGRAMSDLRASAERHGIGGVRTLAMDARRFDPSREAFDAAILDPPREGAGEVLRRVLRNRPRRVVLVSCDVVAGARDVATARQAGYRLREARAFDLFPDTRHVEVVSVLDR